MAVFVERLGMAQPVKIKIERPLFTPPAEKPSVVVETITTSSMPRTSDTGDIVVISPTGWAKAEIFRAQNPTPADIVAEGLNGSSRNRGSFVDVSA